MHGFPSGRTIKEGDIVSVDCGVNRSGFYGDAAFTKIVGEVSEPVKRLVETTEKGLYNGIEKAVHNGRLHDISLAVQSTAQDTDFGIVKEFGGHGVGFDVHEKPFVPNHVAGMNCRLKVGLVIAIEPMFTEGSPDIRIKSDGWTVVTKDGKMAAHFEHSIAILEDGPKILSKL